MIIFDQTIIGFIHKSQQMMKEVIAEIGLPLRKTRFVVNGYLYPIIIVVFEGKELAHFNSEFLQIALHKKLIYSAKDSVLRDIIRHEVVHYLTFILHGNVASHGKEFHEVCSRFGFHPSVADATMNLEAVNEEKVGDLESEKVLEKVKKLLQLAQSSNTHEAELATLKANELLIRHNLNHTQLADDPIYLDRLLQRPRKDTKICAIQSILKHFIVKAVLSSGTNSCCLEISGTLTNVKLARYVAEFLDREFDHLWQEAQTEHGLKGLRSKNSFFAGIAKGFDQKMMKTRSDLSPQDQKALVLVHHDLEEKTKMIYRRLASYSSQGQTDQHAGRLGQEKGKNLNIRKGIDSSSKGLYLPW